jgi:hypothetical protein
VSFSRAFARGAAPGLVGAILAAGAIAFAGCLGADATATKTFKCPRRESFTGEPADGGADLAGASAFMERRCGTLDCHGAVSRPMRLYGRYGLRDPSEKNVTGGAPTTPLELDENYASACNVEPEKMDQAAADFGQSAEKLLLLEKARGVEGHKGGTIVKQGDEGDNCLLGWLRGDPLAAVAPHCQKAIDQLP